MSDIRRPKGLGYGGRAVVAVLATIAGTLLATAIPALAHDRGHVPLAPVQGTVTQAGSGKVQVSTNSGAVAVSLTSRTHVVRVVSGSTADLHANQIVDLHVVPGTTTVDVLRIDGTARPAGTNPGGPPKHRDFNPKQNFLQDEVSTTHGHGAPGTPPNHVDGVVVSASASSITIRTRTGKSTYTLSTSVVVHKLIAGSTTDLAPGEMVQIVRGRDGSALLITIMTA